nr:uncharacterized protein LOC109188162 [Ipomoea batatas]
MKISDGVMDMLAEWLGRGAVEAVAEDIHIRRFGAAQFLPVGPPWQRILYDNHSSLCRVSKQIFPFTPAEEQAVKDALLLTKHRNYHLQLPDCQDLQVFPSHQSPPETDNRRLLLGAMQARNCFPEAAMLGQILLAERKFVAAALFHHEEGADLIAELWRRRRRRPRQAASFQRRSQQSPLALKPASSLLDQQRWWLGTAVEVQPSLAERRRCRKRLRASSFPLTTFRPSVWSTVQSQTYPIALNASLSTPHIASALSLKNISPFSSFFDH